MRFVGRGRGRGRGRSCGGKGSLVPATASASASVFLLPSFASAAAGGPPGAVVVDPVLLSGVEELVLVLVVAEARMRRLGQVVHHARMGPLRLTAAHMSVWRDLVLLLLTMVVVVVVSRRVSQQVSHVSLVSRMMEVAPEVGEGRLRVVGGVGRQVRRAPGHHLVGRMGRCRGGGRRGGGGGSVIVGISGKHHIDHVVV